MPPQNTFPLSLGQEFWCLLDRGDLVGSFGQRCVIVRAWRLSGKIDIDALQAALDDVVVRHEVLRTSIKRDAKPRYQTVHPPAPVSLRVRDLRPAAGESRSLCAEKLMNEVEASPFRVHDLPLLRAVLGRFDDRDSVLVLVAHHAATDAWSMGLIIRDLAARYAHRRGFSSPALPDVPQHRELAEAQRAAITDAAVREAAAYWKRKLSGTRMFMVPCQPLPPQDAIRPYSMHNFVVRGEPAAQVASLARQTRSTVFMVLLAAFYLLAHEITSSCDLVASTFTAGRNDPRFSGTVGILFNFLPIRTDISGCASFRDVLLATRSNCLEAYRYDVPFSHIEPYVPDLWPTPADGDVTTMSFEMIQFPEGSESEMVGDISYSQLRRRQLSPPVSTDIPNGVLWAMDMPPAGDLDGSVLYNPDQFSEPVMAGLISDYRRLLCESVAAPDEPWRVTARPAT